MNIAFFVNEPMNNPIENSALKFNKELIKGFEELGHKIFLVNFSEKDVLNQINETFRQRIDFGFGFNIIYAYCLNIKNEADENIFNKLNIPFVNWFWDGICVPTNPAARYPGINHLLVACMNEDEVYDFKILSPHVKQAFFLPLSGCFADNKGGGYKLIKDRRYKISFIGTYSSEFLKRSWEGMPKAIENLLNDIIDLIIDDPMLPMVSAVKKVLNAKNMAVDDQWFRKFCLNYLSYINMFRRTYLRAKIIRTIAKSGLKINVFGKDFNAESNEHWKAEKWVIAGKGSTYAEDLKIHTDSQIALNIGMFTGGLHDRIFSAMFSGAVSLTDPSTCYSKYFVDGQDSLTFDWKHLDELPQKICKYLLDEDKMQEIADAGRKKAFEQHTWRHRAEKIVEQVELYKIVNGI